MLTFTCPVCSKRNRKVNDTLANYIGYGKIYSILYKIFRVKEDWSFHSTLHEEETWEEFKRHLEKSHGIKNIRRPLVPSY